MRPRRALAASFEVVFVCTANICRSPYAEAVARAAGLPGVSFTSAGTHALSGLPIDGVMAAEFGDGVQATGHRARQLDHELAGASDLIVAMSEKHRQYVLEEWPQLAQNVFVIGYLARRLVDLPAEATRYGLTDFLWTHRSSIPADSVADPYGRGQEAAAICARQIEAYIQAINQGLTDITT